MARQNGVAVARIPIGVRLDEAASIIYSVVKEDFGWDAYQCLAVQPGSHAERRSVSSPALI